MSRIFQSHSLRDHFDGATNLREIAGIMRIPPTLEPYRNVQFIFHL